MTAPALAPPFTAIALDKNSPDPFWRQLLVQVSALIESGAVGEGFNLPAERELALALGVSRATVKRCYDELRRTQQLGGKGRGGSVVQAVKQVQPTLGRLKGFTEEMQELGLTASTELLVREVVASRVIASVFGRPSTALFLRLVRTRLADGVPMTREVAWYDISVAPALADWAAMGSAYAFIQKEAGVTLGWAEQTVESVLSSPEETQTFGFASPQPCLLFKRKTYSAQEVLVEYVEGTFRGDAYVYKLRLEA